MTLDEKLKNLPSDPGVYLMHDDRGNVIYVGKARVLKNRVRQYFHHGKKDERIQTLVKLISDFNYIITLTEKDAFALESSLVKKHNPKFNILLKDDKSAPYIRIDLRTEFPSMQVVRKVKRDGARYFGPYFSGVRVMDIVAIVRAAYKVRFCKGRFGRRECLNYHINLCLGPCHSKVSKEEYRAAANKAAAFLGGRDDEAKMVIEERMKRAAESEDFERAIGYREQLGMIERLKERHISSMGNIEDADSFYLASDGINCCVAVNVVRGGRMMGARVFYLGQVVGDLSSFISQYYDGNEIPKRVNLGMQRESLEMERENMEMKTLVPAKYGDMLSHSHLERSTKCEAEGFHSAEPEIYCFANKMLGYAQDDHENRESNNNINFEGLAEYLSVLKGGRVIVSIPEKGVMKKLVDMAKRNAVEHLNSGADKYKREQDLTTGACERLGKLLGIESLRRIECYDVSNSAGEDIVASGVVFVDGKPDKSGYRRYKIKTTAGQDDYAAIREVMERRFRDNRLLASNSKDPLDSPLCGPAKDDNFQLSAIDYQPIISQSNSPDLIVIDGGKGQLAAAWEILASKLGSKNIISLAKREETIFRINDAPISLAKGDYALRLLMRARDEAHRFANSYNRLLRGGKLGSLLEQINGVGEAKRKKILANISFSQIKSLSADEIAAKAGIDIKTAQNIAEFFKSQA